MSTRIFYNYLRADTVTELLNKVAEAHKNIREQGGDLKLVSSHYDPVGSSANGQAVSEPGHVAIIVEIWQQGNHDPYSSFNPSGSVHRIGA